MPSSKRKTKVHLTQTKKRESGFKSAQIERIREYVDKYDRLFVFNYDNVRSKQIANIRAEFKKDSAVFMGKNTLMSIALGRSPEDEYADDLHIFSSRIRGNCGLLATNRTEQEVLKFFEDFEVADYAMAGFVPNRSHTLQPGLTEWPANMADQLKRLGVFTEVENGKLRIRAELVLCEKGTPLTVEQSKLLTLQEMKLATSRFKLVCSWEKGVYREYKDTE